MDYENKPEGYYHNVRHEMIKYLPNDAKKIIDIGCGNGAFAEIIKEKNNAEVWGIEYMEAFGKEAREKLENTVARRSRSNPPKALEMAVRACSADARKPRKLKINFKNRRNRTKFAKT